MLFSSVRTLSKIFLILLALLAARHSYASDPPISIVCPCNVERVNQTKAVAKFSVVFDKEVTESGEFSVKLNHRETIGSRSYYTFSEVTVSSMPFFGDTQSSEIAFPFNAYLAANDQYLFLALHSPTGEIIDSVALNELPMSIGDGYGVWPSSENQIMFEVLPSFQYDDSRFSLSVEKLSNTNLKNVSDVLTVEVSVANVDGSYYTKSQVETTIEYDANGVGSLNISGPLTRTMDSHLALNPGHINIDISILREGNMLLLYQVGVLPGETMPAFALNLNNIDTLTDSDSDGITDFNERLIGTSVTESNSIGPIPIEVAFTYGSSAEDNQGIGLQARIAHILAVANAALDDSGVNVEIQNAGSYSVGEDGGLKGEQVLDSLQSREGIFSGIDDVLERKPDFFIHLSTGEVLDTGGIATLLGGQAQGILDYKNIYSVANNRGAVAIDNIDLTLMHELGHLMGLDHARVQYEGSTGGTFRWSSGYGVNNDFATLMAYNSAFGSASWLSLLSNPNLMCGSSNSPCGVDRGDHLNGADSVTSLAVTALQASAISNGFPPTITLFGDKTVNLTIGQSYSEPGFSAYDKEDGNQTSSVVVTNNIDNTRSATYSVTYEVSDSDGNQSSSTRSVVVGGSGPEPESEPEPELEPEPEPEPTTSDADNDGLSDSQEASYGTNPLLADTDGDDYLDGEEVDSGADPLDAYDLPSEGLNWHVFKAATDQQDEATQGSN